ncbi:MAG: hypothetical protein ACYC91_02670 [Solirubrobacteraceae bacterium]
MTHFRNMPGSGPRRRFCVALAVAGMMLWLVPASDSYVEPWSVTLDRTVLRQAEVFNGVDSYYGTPAVVIPTARTPVVQLSRFLPGLRRGERLTIMTEAEVTNNISLGKREGFDVSAGAALQLSLVLARSAHATSGVLLQREPPVAITPHEHHHTFTEDVQLTLRHSYGGRFLNEVMTAWLPDHPRARCVLRNYQVAAPLNSTGTPIRCVVTGEAHYGEISVLRFRRSPDRAAGGAVIGPPVAVTRRLWRPAGSVIGLAPKPYRVVMAVRFPTLNRGDIIAARAVVGARLDRRGIYHRVDCIDMLGSQLWLSRYPVVPVAVGQAMDTGTASNLYSHAPTEKMHKAAAISVAQSYPQGAWVMAIAWSSNLSYCVSPMPLSFDPAMSSLTATRYSTARHP